MKADRPIAADGAAPSDEEADQQPRTDPARLIEESEPKGVKAVLGRLRRSGHAGVPREIEDIVRLVRARHPRSDTRLIARAHVVAQAAHEGQKRKSGESFIEHPIGVARILAELGMDPVTISAAFLHDCVEDTDLEIEDLRGVFGDEVAEIIDGLTKIKRIDFRTREEEQAENLRKMIVAMARDIRVIIIKLADRLHNMRTIDALRTEKRETVAAETLDIYAPLALRLGIEQVRAELEDLAFKALHPKRYVEIDQMVTQRQPTREEYLAKVIAQVRNKLRGAKVRSEVVGRPKHYYSIYEKMVKRGREFDEIYDLVGVRIHVDTLKDCYAALGAIHSLWRPVPGRFKDYIAVPKFNLYQSLHTTVVGPEGKPLEIQIRTKEMHRIAEWGVAAHWQYKEGDGGGAQSAWMHRMIEHQETEDDTEFLESLRLDLFSDEVFVFTPKGDVRELPKGATPLDFAYVIHTEVGHSCVGARVDGRLVPLEYQLSSGEIVEIITSKSGRGPSRDWLDIVVTPRARTKIKQWFSKERREEAIAEGKDALAKALRRAGLPPTAMRSDALAAVAEQMRVPSLDTLYQEIGEGRQSVHTVVTRLLRDRVESSEEDEPPPPAQVRTQTPATGVSVKGIDDVWVKLARCCMPVPDDPIVGFITRGRGVSVHRTDCPNAPYLRDREGERFVDVAWNSDVEGIFPVSIEVEALDRAKLLRDVTTTISDFGVNITAATSHATGGIATLRFTFELPDPSRLSTILMAVRHVEAVYDAYRLTPSRD